VNYRHAFHAGSFADVFKHAVLCRILHYLRGKPAAFRVIDTHAGAGLYDLTGAQASRGGEWHDGIERLLAARLPEPVAALLAPYLDAIGALNERGRLKTYPGSPAIARAWLRPQDRLIACDLEPKAAAALGRSLRGDNRIKTLAVDGWTRPAAAPDGAAWCWSIRRSKRMAISALSRLAWRTANGPPASMPCGIRLRTGASRTPSPSACAGSGLARPCGRNFTSRRSATRPG
jgi:hypothetical protein